MRPYLSPCRGPLSTRTESPASSFSLSAASLKHASPRSGVSTPKSRIRVLPEPKVSPSMIPVTGTLGQSGQHSTVTQGGDSTLCPGEVLLGGATELQAITKEKKTNAIVSLNTVRPLLCSPPGRLQTIL